MVLISAFILPVLKEKTTAYSITTLLILVGSALNYILTLTESTLLSSFLSSFKNSNYGETLVALSEVPS